MKWSANVERTLATPGGAKVDRTVAVHSGASENTSDVISEVVQQEKTDVPNTSINEEGGGTLTDRNQYHQKPKQQASNSNSNHARSDTDCTYGSHHARSDSDCNYGSKKKVKSATKMNSGAPNNADLVCDGPLGVQDAPTNVTLPDGRVLHTSIRIPGPSFRPLLQIVNFESEIASSNENRRELNGQEESNYIHAASQTGDDGRSDTDNDSIAAAEEHVGTAPEAPNRPDTEEIEMSEVINSTDSLAGSDLDNEQSQGHLARYTTVERNRFTARSNSRHDTVLDKMKLSKDVLCSRPLAVGEIK